MNKSPTVSLQQRANNQAERLGFEPPVRLPVRQFSKLVVSATHPNFLFNRISSQMRCKDRGNF